MRLLFYGLLIIHVFATPLFAQNYEKLTLDNCIEKALSNSNDVQIAKLTFKKAKLEYEKVRISQHMPQLSLSATTPSYNKSSSLEFIPGKGDVWIDRTLTRYEGSLNLTQNLFTGGNLSLSSSANQYQYRYSELPDNEYTRVESKISLEQPFFQGNDYKLTWKQANRDLENARLQYENSIIDISKEATQLFMDILIARKKLVLEKQFLELYQEKMESDELKYEKGLISELELLQAEIDLNTAMSNVEEYKANFSLNIQKLNNLLQENISDIEASGADSFWIEPAIEMETVAWNQFRSPENYRNLIEARHTLESAKESLESAHDKNNLSVSFRGSYGYEGEGDYFSGAFDKLLDWKNENLSAMLILELPIWDGGAISKDIQIAKADYEIAQLEFKEKQESAILELQEKVQEGERLELKLRRDKKNQILSGKKLEVGQNQYDNGLLSFQDFMEIQQDYVSSVTSLWQTFTDYKIVLWDLEKLTGKLDVSVNF